MQHDSKDPGVPGADQPASAADAAAAADADHAAEGSQPGGEFGPDQLRQIIEALQTENDKLRAELGAEKNQALRLLAEMDNLRKRTEREKLEAAKYGITRLAGDVVNVADNFERALNAVPAGSDSENPTLKALHEGVAMTEREFIKVLEKHGVKRISPVGEAFNPHQHQAVMEQENVEVAAGTVLQVFQAGYLIEDRVLRPAMVVVSRGGAKAPKPAPSAENGGTKPAANDDMPPAGEDGTSQG